MSTPYAPRGSIPLLRARIFNALCEHPYGLGLQDLIAAVYPDVDREPDWADRCVYIAISALNRGWREQRAWFRIGRASPARYALFIRRPRRQA